MLYPPELLNVVLSLGPINPDQPFETYTFDAVVWALRGVVQSGKKSGQREPGYAERVSLIEKELGAK